MVAPPGTTIEVQARRQGSKLAHTCARGPRMPVSAVTAHALALAEERDKVLAAGMDDYVSKPVSQRVLLQVLERWWSSSPTRRRM